MSKSLVDQINSLNATKKLIISLVVGIVAYLIFAFYQKSLLTHLLFGWDLFAICQLLLAWITFYTTTPSGIRNQARKQDDNSVVIFFVILIATCTSVLAVVLLLINKSTDTSDKALRLTIALACMLLSWFLVHTIFTIRYAHIYYADKKKKENIEKGESSYAGGLNFPDDQEPDFLDFAYFSFTAGMTFQVSDVEVSSKELRRLTFLHSLISFGYNATIIAISVNIIGGLSKN